MSAEKFQPHQHCQLSDGDDLSETGVVSMALCGFRCEQYKIGLSVTYLDHPHDKAVLKCGVLEMWKWVCPC
jgi:hypothetical protein